MIASLSNRTPLGKYQTHSSVLHLLLYTAVYCRRPTSSSEGNFPTATLPWWRRWILDARWGFVAGANKPSPIFVCPSFFAVLFPLDLRLAFSPSKGNVLLKATKKDNTCALSSQGEGVAHRWRGGRVAFRSGENEGEKCRRNFYLLAPVAPRRLCGERSFSWRAFAKTTPNLILHEFSLEYTLFWALPIIFLLLKLFFSTAEKKFHRSPLKQRS